MAATGGDIEKELIEYIGEEAFLKLVENFAGTRLYVPTLYHNEPSQVETVLGRQAAEELNRYYGGSRLFVPLSREFRASHYRKNGMSNMRIALKLGITEKGVETLFRRLKQKKGSGTVKPGLAGPTRDKRSRSTVAY